MTTDGRDGTPTAGPGSVPPTAGGDGTARSDAAPALPADLSFDEALAELQVTVAALEAGGLPLERTIELYERGVALHDRCSALLGDAELRIRRLEEIPGGRPTLVDDGGPYDRTAREEHD